MKVRRFLAAASWDGASGRRVPSIPSLRQLWGEIGDLHWPPSGPPQPQPDVD